MLNTKVNQNPKVHSSAWLLIFLSWLMYSVSYLGKLNYSANITQIVDYYNISKSEAGVVPSFFFFAYGIGQVVNGLLCKKYNIKWVIFAGLFTSAVINLVIPLTTNFGIVKWLWMINGFALSTLWPTIIRLLSETLPQKALEKSSVIMGTTVAVGTLVIYGLSSVFALFDNFKLAFYSAAASAVLVSLIWLFLYKKAVIAANDEKESAEQIKYTKLEQNDTSNGKGMIYVTIIMLCMYAIVVNLTKDGLTTWVPSILKEEFSTSDSLSILLTLTLPIIATFGNFGALKIHKKIPSYVNQCFITFCIVGGLIGVIIASITMKQMIMTLVGLIAVNFLASSLNSLITSIFPMFMRGKVNSGLFAGVLNGFCYVGSTISSYGLGSVADEFGWLAVFWLLLGCCALAGVLWCVYAYIRHRFYTGEKAHMDAN